MRVAVDVLAPVGEPHVQVQDEHVLGMMLRAGFIEVCLQRFAMRRITFQAGEWDFSLVAWNDGLEPATRSVCSFAFPMPL